MSNQPLYYAYVVSETKQGFQKKTRWTRVGAVWPHEKGEGFAVVIADGIAVTGRLVCLPPKPEDNGTTHGTP